MVLLTTNSVFYFKTYLPRVQVLLATFAVPVHNTSQLSCAHATLQVINHEYSVFIPEAACHYLLCRDNFFLIYVVDVTQAVSIAYFEPLFRGQNGGPRCDNTRT